MRPGVGEGWLCVHVVNLVRTVPIATEMAIRVVNDHSHRGDGLKFDSVELIVRRRGSSHTPVRC